MLHLLTRTALAALLIIPALAQTTCSTTSKCPEDTPCCSQYGQCGTGAYCLGGCDPKSSFQIDSCVPAPVCRNESYTFTNLDSITSETKYLGNASSTDWVSSGEPVSYDDSVLLTLAQGTSGTVLASAAYVWYGKVSATMKTARTQGVVTAFILLSDMKDEIDCEFVGSELETLQTNYYFQGFLDYDNELNVNVTDTFDNWHTYEIDWTPDYITWSVDGQVGRTKNRNETWNSTSNQWMFPQTPSRIELSVWPAGESSNGEGTIEWAGGLINWNSTDIQNNGYFYATVQSVNVTCYAPPAGANVQGDNAYIYTSSVGTNNTVEITNNSTVLDSLLGTGTNMTANYASSSASGSATGAATSAANVVPGLSGPGVVPGGGDSSGSGASSASQSTSAQATATGLGGFSQGGTNTGGSSGKSSASLSIERTIHGSGFAALVLFIAIAAL